MEDKDVDPQASKLLVFPSSKREKMVEESGGEGVASGGEGERKVFLCQLVFLSFLSPRQVRTNEKIHSFLPLKGWSTIMGKRAREKLKKNLARQVP